MIMYPEAVWVFKIVATRGQLHSEFLPSGPVKGVGSVRTWNLLYESEDKYHRIQMVLKLIKL